MTLNLKGQEPGALMSGCGQEKMDISGERGQNLFPLLLFVLFWPSPDWAVPTRMSEGRPSLLHQLNQMLVSSMNTDTPASVKVERLKSISRQKCVLVTQLCPTVSFPMDCSLQGSSIHGILQVRILGNHSLIQGINPPNRGTAPGSPALQTDSLPSELPGKPI